MPTFGKNKKNENETESNLILNAIHEQNDMEIEEMRPPLPDSDNNQVLQIDNQSEVHLNEDALKELIKKEEENLSKQKKDKIKNFDEIKKDINSLSANLNLNKLKIYEDQFYSDLKKQISE